VYDGGFCLDWCCAACMRVRASWCKTANMVKLWCAHNEHCTMKRASFVEKF
jgi:hypothetical protein